MMCGFEFLQSVDQLTGNRRGGKRLHGRGRRSQHTVRFKVVLIAPLRLQQRDRTDQQWIASRLGMPGSSLQRTVGGLLRTSGSRCDGL
ncbi:MAG: hypothetical protein DLM58_04270 [Pseudonocardiales bacterium]|nr:MAG: hypothetical protein DLM58_04270 [Pseudonocardiales bacterium]